MKKYILVFLLSFGISFDTVLAVPRISPEMDLQCAIEVYGVKVNPRLDALVEKKVDQVYLQVRYTFDLDFPIFWGYGVMPNITTAGISFPQFNLIFFNPLYLNKYREVFIEEVVTHEIAHLVTYQLFGNVGDAHGREWQFVMKKLGINSPQRYHSYTFCAENDGRIKLPAIQ